MPIGSLTGKGQIESINGVPTIVAKNNPITHQASRRLPREASRSSGTITTPCSSITARELSGS
jgi:hypothetical protein